MTFKEWYKAFCGPAGCYQLATDLSIKQLAEKAWNMGETEGINKCRSLDKIKELIAMLQPEERVDLVLHMQDYCELCGKERFCNLYDKYLCKGHK